MDKLWPKHNTKRDEQESKKARKQESKKSNKQLPNIYKDKNAG